MCAPAVGRSAITDGRTGYANYTTVVAALCEQRIFFFFLVFIAVAVYFIYLCPFVVARLVLDTLTCMNTNSVDNGASSAASSITDLTINIVREKW